MQKYLPYYLLIAFLFSSIYALESAEPSDQKLKTLYSSLDPTSLAQHLAFYELYEERPMGQQALKDAWQILAGPQTTASLITHVVPLSSSVINALIALVNKQSEGELPILDEQDLQEIDKFAQRLSHKKLKGHYALSEAEVLQLASPDVDLARGLFLSELGPNYPRIKTYEALLDLMALQILARLPKNATPEDKIREINALIFEEMGFRFPPKSTFSQDIDLYSFLPSVLDSHRGVCLGVSILYLCLAQRIDLKLEIITPPGHIYVRYQDANKTINIETTVRGIHMDSERYLSIDTYALQQRTIKETIGLAHFNQASVFWQQNNYELAKQAYLRAQPYLKEDCALKEVLGYTYLLTDQKVEGEKLLWEIKDYTPNYAITKNPIAAEYFAGYLDKECIKILFSRTEENRASLMEQKNALEETVKRCPRFSSGIIQLALAWIKLHRYGEALEVLKNAENLQVDDPEVNYYLAALYALRSNYPKAWQHLQKAEKIVHEKGHHPKALREFRRELLQECPESLF